MDKKNISKVLILGSKPGAVIPAFDHAYCANASAGYYQDELIHVGGKIVSVVSATEIIESQRIGSKDKDKWLSEKKKMIADFPSSKILLHWIDVYPRAIQSLIDAGCKSKIEALPSSDVKRLEKNLCGVREPIFTYDHLRGGSRRALLNVIAYLDQRFRSIFDRCYNVTGLYRPSTGIVSLLYAISVHGADAEYIVSGIGIKGRGSYPDGSINTWSRKINLDSYHVLVDKKIIEILSAKYNIRTTENGLGSILRMYDGRS